MKNRNLSEAYRASLQLIADLEKENLCLHEKAIKKAWKQAKHFKEAIILQSLRGQ